MRVPNRIRKDLTVSDQTAEESVGGLTAAVGSTNGALVAGFGLIAVGSVVAANCLSRCLLLRHDDPGGWISSRQNSASVIRTKSWLHTLCSAGGVRRLARVVRTSWAVRGS